MEEMEVERVEVAGELIDAFTGKSWAVPKDNCDDISDRIAPNPMAMPPGREDARFHYQWIRTEQWSEYQAAGAVRVTMKEFSGEGAESMADEYGKPLTSYVQFENAILIKMPKFIAESRYKQQDADARLAVQDILKPKRTTKSDGARGTVEEGVDATVTETEIATAPSRSGRR